jgi:predicted transcriptional regulator
MIQFEDMENRYKALGLSRKWLADETPYSESYIRTVLAPRSTRRTDRIQRILSDAIEREEERRKAEGIVALPVSLPDRVTIECKPEERRAWQAAAMASPSKNFDKWAVVELNKAAALKVDLSPENFTQAAEDVGTAGVMPIQKQGTTYREKKAGNGH